MKMVDLKILWTLLKLGKSPRKPRLIWNILFFFYIHTYIYIYIINLNKREEKTASRNPNHWSSETEEGKKKKEMLREEKKRNYERFPLPPLH